LIIILNDLPEEHWLRNTPLGEIKAEYRWKKAIYTAPWRTVEVGAPKLVNFTYNDLGDSWTLFDYWAVKDGTDTSM
jgi:hypothetical protein